jgi:hypothetical protein
MTIEEFYEKYKDRWEWDGTCRKWTGGHVSWYPYVYSDYKHIRVSRFICELINGPPPTEKHQAAHNVPDGCIGRRCIEFTHIRWATQSENEMDKPEHIRNQNAKKAGKVSGALYGSRNTLGT